MADFAGRLLAARGVTHAFGHPGSDVMDLIEAFEQAGIQFILTHHENTAAYMANVVGQLTGRPGIAMATKGPGVTNIASGVAAAFLDRAPQLCFTSHIDAETAASYTHQHLPVVEFYSTITKLAEELTAANASELLPRAYATALASLPGSVYLPSSANQQTRQMPQDDSALQAIIDKPYEPESLPVPDISEAAAIVSGSKKLMVLVGPGLNHLDLNADLLALVEALGAPVCVTPEAIGQVPADHPQYAGMFAWYDDGLRKMLSEADTVLTLGADGWDSLATYKGPGKVVSLAAAGADDRVFQPAVAALDGDLGKMMRALAEKGRGERTWNAGHAAEILGGIDHNLSVSTEHKESDGIPPQSVFTALREVAPRDTIFSLDVGAHKSLGCQAWRSYQPKTFSLSNGLSPMGFGIASAMGAKIACPDKTVVTVTGDGGLMMYAGELATWSRLNLPLTLVVMVDANLTQVQRRQERKGYSLNSTTFQIVDFCGLAKVHGIDSLRATNSAELKTVVEKAVKANRPMLVEAVLDTEEYRRIPGTP